MSVGVREVLTVDDSLRILVDSCVWVDNYLGYHPRHDESFAFLDRAYGAGATLLYGASKLETVFYVLVAEAKRLVRAERGAVSETDAASARAFAWGCLENIRSCATAVGVDEADLWLASKYRSVGPDFEDNVLLAAAQRANADYLVTWDAALLRKPTVRTATPTEMLALIDL